MIQMTGLKWATSGSAAFSFVLALLTATFIGCGSGVATAPVSGKVSHAGQPVNGGVVTFAPVKSDVEGAKPAVGEVQPDGTFSLGTNAKGDGAVIGQHRVVYSPPVVETPPVQEGKHAEAPPASPYAGLIPKENEVEVKAGSNEVNIELVPDPAAPPQSAPAPTSGQ